MLTVRQIFYLEVRRGIDERTYSLIVPHFRVRVGVGYPATPARSNKYRWYHLTSYPFLHASS